MAVFLVSSGQVVSGNTLDGGFEYVLSGGTSLETTILGGGRLTDEGYVSGTKVASGLLEVVGSAAATTVGSGGLALIEGTATGVTVNAGGYAIVTPGSHATNVTANGGTVISTGNALVSGSVVQSAAATLNGTSVGTRQILYTLSGGVTNAATLSGGTQDVYAGGSANTTTIVEGTQDVGGYASGTTVGTFAASGFGATQVVGSGGITDATTVQYGGEQVVQSGGLARGSLVSSGGQAEVFGGTMRNAEVGNGGIAFVYSGAFNAGAVDSGGLVLVLDGTDAGNTVAQGGHLIDSGVAVLSNTASGIALVESATQVAGYTVSAGERAYVLKGGTTTGTNLTGGTEDVYNGGVTTGTIMSYGMMSGGLLEEIVHTGGIASGTQVEAGIQIVAGGQAASAFVLSASQSVEAGSATDTTVGDEARQYVLSSGVARRTTVSSGGAELVGFASQRFGGGQAGGTAVSTTVEGGGSLQVANGGVVRNATLLAGAGALIDSAGTQSGTTVSLGASEILLSGSVSSDTTVAGGTIVVLPGAKVTGTTNNGSVISTGVVLASGGFVVSTAQNATSYVISGGEQLYVLPTGTTTSAMIEGGSEEVTSGGVALYSTVSGGTDLIDAGGTTTSATLVAGAFQIVKGTANATTVTEESTQIVSSGGQALDAVVVSYGDQEVAGGTAYRTQVGLSGTQNVTSGLASGTMVASGGDQSVAGGTASGTMVASGGEVDVYGGTAVGATISAGGVENVGGGTASATHVMSGATEFVISGGTAANAVVDAGGFQVVYPGGAATGTTGAGTVVSTGVVVISGSEAVAAAPSETGTVVGQGYRYDVLPTGTTTSVTLSGGGEEDLYAGASATSTSILAGGRMVVNSGGTAIADVVNGGNETINAGGLAKGATVENGSVTDYGTTSGMHIGQGAATIYGSAANTSVGSGGSLYVYSSLANGGVNLAAIGNAGNAGSSQTTDTFVGSGGFEYVRGGSVMGTTVGNGGTEVLQVYATSTGFTVDGTVTGTKVLAGGSIELDGFGFVTGATASINSATDVLTVTEGGQTYTQQLAGDYTGDRVTVTSGAQGTIVTVMCFAAGTRIRTARGDVAVEALRVGDRAVTVSGRLRPIRWLGHRVMDCASQAVPSQVQPVCVAAGAFGAGLPVRDLHLSPGHPVLVGADADGEGGHLVPVMCLINGTTVRRIGLDTVTYWHVELDAHDILLAEGLPAESYLEWGDRSFFGEAPADPLADPDLVVPGLAGRCRPVAIDGPVVEAAHRRLDAMLAARLAGACAWPDEALHL